MTNTTTAAPAPKSAKRPYSTNRLSPRYRNIVPLTGDALPCGICGQWTPSAEQTGTEIVKAIGYSPRTSHEQIVASRKGGAVGDPFETRMTRCITCATLRTEAAQLAAQYPHAVVVGEFAYAGSTAVDVVERALAAVAVTGRNISMRQPRDLKLALEHLVTLGGSLRWQSRFEGLADRDARPDTAAAMPWSHLTEQQVGVARRAFAGYLRARTERPVPVVPTEAAGCYICGIGEVVALPSQAITTWHSVKLSPERLGGKPGTPQTETEVCSTCHAEHNAVGAWGPSLLDKLALRAAGVERHVGAYDVQLNGVKAWGTTGKKRANRTPFEHMNLAQLADDIRAGRL
ncbi:deoxycytidylate deaminase [Leucobacter exalbidus]|uniref:Deoxycytidylate deaminase n=1 Tax=Leucobacter exalbidus TaxID=662960 RepID=A0A940PLK0_9MICO|nr:hypothetical protein [Leucobacter exalbidus]MBP1325313.1 deoxycytidylate deaminase [Leucobacter exalbidus]